MLIRTVAVVPHFRHIDTLPQVIAALRRYQLPVLVVDDGSGEAYRGRLQALCGDGVDVLFRPVNGGKGAAMKWGLKQALQAGYTHALQIDADAQHRFDDIPRLLAQAEQQPQAVVCGKPVYGEDAPKARLYGRKITDFWNVVHTWSFALKDGMCGFRVYPLQETCRVVCEEYVGSRMDFDNEILVHLYWRQVPLLWVDTPVSYHQGGISHFRAWKDNWLISKMHARLFAQMLWRRLKRKV